MPEKISLLPNKQFKSWGSSLIHAYCQPAAAKANNDEVSRLWIKRAPGVASRDKAVKCKISLDPKKIVNVRKKLKIAKRQ